MGLSRRIIALDLGAAHLARVAFRPLPVGRLIIERVTMDGLNPDPAAETGWLDEAIGALARGRGKSGATTLAVPSHLALTKFIKTPSIEKSKRDKIVQFEASQNIPYALEEVVWDHLVVADDGMDLEVMLTAVKADALSLLCDGAHAAGLQVVRALPACLALRRAFLFNHPENNDSVLLADIGARSTNLVFVEPGRFFVRTLPLAGNTITQAIADELRLEFAQAEELKVQVLSGQGELPPRSPEWAAVMKAAEVFAARLYLEITRSMVYLRRHATITPTAAVWLTGGGAGFAAWPTLLTEKLKLPVRIFDPLGRVTLAPGVARASLPGNLAVPVGLAAGQLAADGEAVTLLPKAMREALEARRKQPVLLAAAVMGALALLPPFWHFRERAQAATASIVAIDAQLRPMRTLQSRNATNFAQIEQVRKQIDALHRLAEMKASWINFFTDLQECLGVVEDVWLEQLAVEQVGAERHETDDNDPASPPLRLTVSGRLLEKNDPVSMVSSVSSARVKRLIMSFKNSRFIADVEDEQFDHRQPGMLHFDVTLVVNPQKPL